jgi:gamma-glutamyltranspeptidase / glutathione hydrolase
VEFHTRPFGADALDPHGWDSDVVEPALQAPTAVAAEAGDATGSGERGIVVASTGAFATLAGQQALTVGGSAVDAALSTAFAQIGQCLGSWVSYAGIVSLIHYQAATGKIDTLSAGFRTCAAETDPASIPRPPTPSGRTALVPGFVAGAFAAHYRFGRLPWSSLWSPAIYLAEYGVPITAAFEKMFDARSDALSRTAEARAAFTADGHFPRSGDLFRQPALAATLQAIAQQGPDWMYRGPWAHRFVELVGRDGGRVQLSDLADYQPLWGESLSAEFSGHQVHTMPTPDTGGVALLVALSLIEAADLGDPTRDPDALYWLIRIIERSAAEAYWGSVSAVELERIAAMWQQLRRGSTKTSHESGEGASHSDFVVTADADGNVAAVCHSINTALWGTTGIVVDGIAIPDPATFQQSALARLTPGAHLPMPINPAIALCDGRPVLACSSMGAGMHAVAVQQLDSVLRLGADIYTAADQPLIHAKDIDVDASLAARVADFDPTQPIARAVDDRFDPALLNAVRQRGQLISARAKSDPALPRGYWGAIATGDAAPRYRGARTYGWGPIRGVPD